MEKRIYLPDFKYKSGDFNPNKSNEIYKKRIYIAGIILIFAVFIYFLYFSLFLAKECKNVDCYKESLVNCKKAWFINEEENYVWIYEIFGENDKNSCNVKVVLLKIKNAEINIEDFQGKEMLCRVQKIDDVFPEKDMLRCNGILKEKLQEIIIDKMHNYLLKNLGKIQEGLKEI